MYGTGPTVYGTGSEIYGTGPTVYDSPMSNARTRASMYPSTLYDSPLTLTRRKLRSMDYTDEFVRKHAPYPELEEGLVTVYVNTSIQVRSQREPLVVYTTIPKVFWDSDEYNLDKLVNGGYVFTCCTEEPEYGQLESSVFGRFSHVKACTDDRAAFIAWAGENNVCCRGQELSFRSSIRPPSEHVPDEYLLNTDINLILSDASYAKRFANYWQPISKPKKPEELWHIPSFKADDTEEYRDWHEHMDIATSYIAAIRSMEKAKRHNKPLLHSGRPHKRSRRPDEAEQ